jgi:hypothetical protein
VVNQPINKYNNYKILQVCNNKLFPYTFPNSKEEKCQETKVCIPYSFTLKRDNLMLLLLLPSCPSSGWLQASTKSLNFAMHRDARDFYSQSK